jgi:hypothetical protein
MLGTALTQETSIGSAVLHYKFDGIGMTLRCWHDIITVNVARMLEVSKAHRILLGIPKEGTQQKIPRRKWEDNIKTEFKEIIYECIFVAQYRIDWICVKCDELPDSLTFSVFHKKSNDSHLL